MLWHWKSGFYLQISFLTSQINLGSLQEVDANAFNLMSERILLFSPFKSPVNKKRNRSIYYTSWIHLWLSNLVFYCCVVKFLNSWKKNLTCKLFITERYLSSGHGKCGPMWPTGVSNFCPRSTQLPLTIAINPSCARSYWNNVIHCIQRYMAGKEVDLSKVKDGKQCEICNKSWKILNLD